MHLYHMGIGTLRGQKKTTVPLELVTAGHELSYVGYL